MVKSKWLKRNDKKIQISILKWWSLHIFLQNVLTIGQLHVIQSRQFHVIQSRQFHVMQTTVTCDSKSTVSCDADNSFMWFKVDSFMWCKAGSFMWAQSYMLHVKNPNVDHYSDAVLTYSCFHKSNFIVASDLNIAS